MTKLKFEEALSRLEEIVHQLEEGSLGLDESLKIFEEGIRLTHLCTKKLTESEKKIQILIKTEGGEKTLQPFDMGEDASSFETEEETASKKEDNLT